MVEGKLKDRLKHQHYGLAGSHSSVKVCSWTRKSLYDEGFCYKQKFYGIRSHLCCQMTPSVGYCMNNCIYCWRTVEYSKKEFEPVDGPEEIYDECIKAQRRLISGFKGEKRCNQQKWKGAQEPRHFAISLSGEPTMYPRLSEFIRTVHSHGGTTFLVTNGMLPEVLEKLEMPTQLYLSLSTADERDFKRIHQPLFTDGWERLNRSLEVLKRLKGKTRTTIRVTAIKGVNMKEPEKWAGLIQKAEPKFVEIKAYMHLGASRKYLQKENMPLHTEVREFALEIGKHLGYRLIDEKADSRVVLMMKEDSPDRIMKFD
jgi:tRNA wybutosine-synthesizing protein 1